MLHIVVHVNGLDAIELIRFCCLKIARRGDYATTGLYSVH